jgi:outer membrane protein assembly factor BamA
LLSAKSFGQADAVKISANQDSSAIKTSNNQDSLDGNNREKTPGKDMGDVWHSMFGSHNSSADSAAKASAADAAAGIKDTRTHLSFLPAAGYTLQTGFAGVLSGNIAFNIDASPNSKLSNINTSFTYSQYKQIILPLQANFWTKGNRYNFITDIRYIDYPSAVYGLGGRTDPNKGYTINFAGLKLHQTVLKSISQDLYIGIGYYYDRFWHIKAIDKVSRTVNRQMEKELGKTETASGVALRFLYDTRLNQINPQQGVFYNITYRTSSKSLGSDSNWNSLQIDARAYTRFPKRSHNTLAFWMLDWVASSGVPPYLLLPSTGWDDNYNTGRGYIQGRFRGKNMLYFESEYRFALSRNGLLGGVAFVNVENFSSELSPSYSNLYPGYGVGLRLKLNKYSNTNLCVDYGFGKNGSQGFFVNLGEVF